MSGLLRWLLGCREGKQLRRLRARLAVLESELAAERAKSRILEEERTTLAAVLARDRERVKAETATFSRRLVKDLTPNGDSHHVSRLP